MPSLSVLATVQLIWLGMLKVIRKLFLFCIGSFTFWRRVLELERKKVWSFYVLGLYESYWIWLFLLECGVYNLSLVSSREDVNMKVGWLGLGCLVKKKELSVWCSTMCVLLFCFWFMVFGVRLAKSLLCWVLLLILRGVCWEDWEDIEFWRIKTMDSQFDVCWLDSGVKQGLSDRTSKGNSGVDYSGLNEVYMGRTSWRQRYIAYRTYVHVRRRRKRWCSSATKGLVPQGYVLQGLSLTTC